MGPGESSRQSATRVAVDALKIALLTATVLACSGVVPPSFVVPLRPNEWGDYALLVYDGSGLVTNARAAERRPGVAPQDVIAAPDRMELEVGWTGGACSHRPILEITGNSDALRLVIANPNDPQPLPFLPISCPAVGVPLRVTLLLNDPVTQEAVSVEVTY